MAVPHSKREEILLICLLVIIAAVFTVTLNHASSHNAFIGDSLTRQWNFPTVDFGIQGQTSSEILQRFPTQISGQGYRKVFILAGTNDTLLGIDPDITIRNLGAMADLAQQAHAEPILAKIPPIFRDNGRLAPQVNALNASIERLAAARGLKVIDYYDAVHNHPGDYVDGVHFKRRAYLRMEYALLQTTNPF